MLPCIIPDMFHSGTEAQIHPAAASFSGISAADVSNPHPAVDGLLSPTTATKLLQLQLHLLTVSGTLTRDRNISY